MAAILANRPANRANSLKTADTEPVARGFIPDGLRSSSKTCYFGESGKPRSEDLRLLRSRSG
ncbi:hypothetical protein V5O39_25625 [Pseudomonas parakoreensis]